VSMRGQLNEAIATIGPVLANLEPGPASDQPGGRAVSQDEIDRMQGYYFQMFDWSSEPQIMDLDLLSACSLVCSKEGAWAGSQGNIQDCLELSEADPGVTKDMCMNCSPCVEWFHQLSSTISNAAQLMADLGYAAEAEVLDSAAVSTLADVTRAGDKEELEIPLWLKISAAGIVGILVFNWSR